jgi:hypothetical protein
MQFNARLLGRHSCATLYKLDVLLRKWMVLSHPAESTMHTTAPLSGRVVTLTIVLAAVGLTGLLRALVVCQPDATALYLGANKSLLNAIGCLAPELYLPCVVLFTSL